MPDESNAAEEHALLQEVTAPLATLPDDAVPAATDVEFPIVLRGYDRLAVDAYVKRTSQLVAELQATRSPEAAVRRGLERVGEEVAGILQRAHEAASQITAQSRSEAEDRLEQARQEATRMTADAERRLQELDTETDRIWAERQRIVEDAQQLARQLLSLAHAAAARFPAADDPDTTQEAASRMAGVVLPGTQLQPDETAGAEPVAAPGAVGAHEAPGEGDFAGRDEDRDPTEEGAGAGAEGSGADPLAHGDETAETLEDDGDVEATRVMPAISPSEVGEAQWGQEAEQWGDGEPQPGSAEHPWGESH